MTDLTVFTEVMFDFEPVGLADAMSEIPEKIRIVIESDTTAEAGAVIFFGLPVSEGEIMEVKANVCSVSPKESGFALTVEILEVDSAMKAIAVASLKKSSPEATGGKNPVWGIGLKQTNGVYALLVNSPAGVLNSAQLAKIADLSARGAGIVKLTHAQRIILLMPLEKMDEARSELESAGLQIGVLHKGVRNVRACCGSLCRFCQNIDAINTALAIDKVLYGRGAAFDVKIAISDCMRNCSESYCCDIGLIGEKGTYRILVGGRGSQVPFRALNLADGIKPADVPLAVKEIVDWYEKNGNENERLWKLLLRLGEAEIKKYDLSAVEKPLNDLGDGVDEYSRFKDQLARMAGVKVMKNSISFCCRK
ncbi:MAG: hypothetical protein HQM10_23485 [Candidatus Riflebacteria bacterium]|nr:hypothetical protein [Candidatus Riflebacteria bacterium]